MSGRYGSFSDSSEDKDESRSARRAARGHHVSPHRYRDVDSDLYNNSSSEESDSEQEEEEEEDDDHFGAVGESSSKYGSNYHNYQMMAGGKSTSKLKTGRERRKKVARGNKGGEFHEKRRKRRVYFCTLAGEIDLSALKDHILDSRCDWLTKQVGDALILSKISGTNQSRSNYYIPRRIAATAEISGNIELMLSERERSYISNKKNKTHSYSHESSHKPQKRIRGSGKDRDRDKHSSRRRQKRNRDRDRESHPSHHSDSEDRFQDVSDPRHKEVMIFEFGAVVLWGFSVGEESVLLQTIQDFAAEGQGLLASEFTASEDDMAFISHLQQQPLEGSDGINSSPVTTQDCEEGVEEDNNDDIDSLKRKKLSTIEEKFDFNSISIANDVISFPEKTTREHRLAVSYAIAQSSIVAIFEERIMQKVAEYKFIPETLASVGKIELSSKQMGMMVGEIFVIRHDLNLHSDILDTPDFFWGEQDRYVDDYERVTRYLEMDSRVEVLNTRLNMLKDLLDVLNQQMENDHSTKLEWIIIWLIVLEVVIQLISVGTTIMADISMH